MPSGVVLVAALLALTLLASAVFFVFNVGTHVQRRIEAQHAADAAAVAGAGWVARSLNLVAINNVESAKLITQVQIYDGIPSAVRNSARDAEAALQGVENQLQRGLAGHPWLEDALQEVRIDLESQLLMLNRLEVVLTEGYDIREMTQYELPFGAGRGALWEQVASLEQVSLTAMRELGVTAQVAAWHAGAGNLSDEDGRAFLVPFVPEVPWVHGEPTDFIDPIVVGLLPGDRDDEVIRRGPFDVLFGLRRPRISGNVFVEPPYDVVTDFATDTFRDGPPPLAQGEVIRYEVQPIERFYRQQVARAEQAAFDTDFAQGGGGSWFAERANNAARQNMDQLASKLRGGSADETRILDANWETDWDEAEDIEQEILNDPSRSISRMRIKLVFEPEAVDASGDPLDGALTLQSWAMYPDEPAGLIGEGGGRDETFDMDRLSDQVHRDERTLAYTDEAGSSEQRTQYVYTVWCAIEDTQTYEGRFPNNVESVDDLPAPVQLDLAVLDHDDDEARERYLRFFAAADQPAEAPLWAGLFEGDDTPDRPWPRTVAMASAEVFNNHSWDLWTQMWHTQLVPVGDLQGWLDFAADAEGGQGFRTEDLARLTYLPDSFSDDIGETFRYLERVAPLMERLNQPRTPVSPIPGGGE